MIEDGSIFNLKDHQRLRKKFNLCLLQNLEKKIVRLRFEFVESIPQLAHSPTGTSANWHFLQFSFVRLRI